MKHKTQNLVLITLFFLVLIPFGSKAQLKVNSMGNVGIGIEPDNSTYELKVIDAIFPTEPSGTYPSIIISSGPWYKALYPSSNNLCTIGKEGNQFGEVRAQSHYAGTVLLTSDKRLKENFRDIQTPLEKLMQVKGLKFDFIKQQDDSLLNDKLRYKQEKLRKDRMGFIAQDLEKLFPEAVYHDEDADKYYVDYNAIIPVIVEAMKEQQNTIDELSKRVKVLESSGTSIEKSASIETGSTNNEVIENCMLEQNIPNPFSDNTRIDITLPAEISNAVLYVYNMQGKQIKTFNIQERGNTSVTISGYTLDAGMYLYTLIADGKEVDTKKMILTK